MEEGLYESRNMDSLWKVGKVEKKTGLFPEFPERKAHLQTHDFSLLRFYRSKCWIYNLQNYKIAQLCSFKPQNCGSLLKQH